MLESINSRAASAGDVLFNASRALWLASLGAAVVTRDWAEKEASGVLRNLVREGTAVESRAFRFVGDRLDTSFQRANSLWKRARRTVTTSVRAYADTATMFVRDALPATLPTPVKVDVKQTAKRSVKRARKAAAPRTAVKRTRRSKAASKRA